MKKYGFALLMLILSLSGSAFPQGGAELRFCLRSEPKTFNPLLVEEDSSDTVRYLTGGVLVRLNPSIVAPEVACARN